MNAGVPTLMVQSDTGLTNQIQTTTNLALANWTVLTNLMVTTSPYTFADNISPPASRRFYRIQVIAPTNSIPANMVLIPAGSFQMGNAFANEGDSSELPVHSVFVSAFYMDKFEVQKSLWDDVRLWSAARGYSYDNTGDGKATNHPAYYMDWYDAVKWCNARSQKEGRVPAYYTDAALTQVYTNGQVAPYVNWNAGYRLPTEAEWEKGARGGLAGHRFPWGNTDLITHSNANYYSSATYSYDVSPTRGYNPAFVDASQIYTSPVGSFAPNGYGLYDMAGNVWEWTWDYAGNYTSASQTDPRGPDSGTSRVGKGGNWNFYAEHLRCSYRFGNAPGYAANNIGFRCALPKSN